MAIKTLEELNREFMAEESAVARIPENNEAQVERPGFSRQTESPEVRRSESNGAQAQVSPFPQEKGSVTAEAGHKKRGMLKNISIMLLGIAVLLVLTTVLTSSRYSFFTVLTGSMHDEIPKGSLILVDKAEPLALSLGDNITFMRDRRNSVTHKIVEVFEDYQGSGQRGFKTKGTNNNNPDREIVAEENVIGKVVFVIPHVGDALSWLGDNIYVFLIVLFFVIILFLIVHLITTIAKGRNRKNAAY